MSVGPIFADYAVGSGLVMVNIGQRARDVIPRMDYIPRVGTPAGVEVMSLSELRRRVTGGFTSPHRPDFHLLIGTARGELRQEVDFKIYDATPGSWLWVRPGQVQRWGDISDVEGHLVLFESDFLDPATALAARIETLGAPVLYTAVDDAVDLAAEHLSREFRALGARPLNVHIAVLRHLLSVLVLALAHPQGGLPNTMETNDTFRRFREAVERDFTRTRQVADYARSLGYSSRTLTRATTSAVGINAKEFIDERVMLEAKRRLAHSDETAARIAAHLGFGSATNFSKFFQSRAGQSPIQFRSTARQVPGR